MDDDSTPLSTRFGAYSALIELGNEVRQRWDGRTIVVLSCTCLPISIKMAFADSRIPLLVMTGVLVSLVLTTSLFASLFQAIALMVVPRIKHEAEALRAYLNQANTTAADKRSAEQIKDKLVVRSLNIRYCTINTIFISCVR